MVAHTRAPRGIALLVATHHPCSACGIKQILRTKDIGIEEELRVFNTAVYVTFGCKVHHYIKAVFGKEAVKQPAVANITLYKIAAFIVNVIGNGAEVACISKQVEHHHTNVIMLGQDVFQVIGTDKACGTCHQIGFHKICIWYILLLFKLLRLRCSLCIVCTHLVCQVNELLHR